MPTPPSWVWGDICSPGSPCPPSVFSTQQQNKPLSPKPSLLASHPDYESKFYDSLESSTMAWPSACSSTYFSHSGLIATLPASKPGLASGAVCVCSSFTATLSRCLQAPGSLCPNTTFSMMPSLVAQHQTAAPDTRCLSPCFIALWSCSLSLARCMFTCCLFIVFIPSTRMCAPRGQRPHCIPRAWNGVWCGISRPVLIA